MIPIGTSLGTRKADDSVEEKDIKRTCLQPPSDTDNKKNITFKRACSSEELEIIVKASEKIPRIAPDKLSVDELTHDLKKLGIRKRGASSDETSREYKIHIAEEKKESAEGKEVSVKRKESSDSEHIVVKFPRSEEEDRYAKYKRKDKPESENMGKQSRVIPSFEKSKVTVDKLSYFEKYEAPCSISSKTAPIVEISENILLSKEVSVEAKSLALFGNNIAYTHNNTCCVRDISDKKSAFQKVYISDSRLQSIEWLNSKQILVEEETPSRVLLVDIVAGEVIKQFLVGHETYSKPLVIARLSDSEFLAGDAAGAVHLIDVTRNTTKKCVKSCGDVISSIVPSEGGPRVALAYRSGRVKIYNLKSWEEPLSCFSIGKTPIKSIAWFPGSSNTLLVAGGEEGGELFVYDIAREEKLLVRKKVDKSITNVIFIDAPLPEFVITRGVRSKTFSGSEVEFYQFSNGQLLKKTSVRANTTPHSIFNAVYSKRCSALIVKTEPSKEKESYIEILNIKRSIEVVSTAKESPKGKGTLFGDYIR